VDHAVWHQVFVQLKKMIRAPSKKKIMKKYLFLSVVAVVVFACNKTTTLPVYTPPIAKNFSVSYFAHTQDTVNFGDTLYVDVAGTMSDTTQNIYPYITAASGSTIFSWGTPPASLSTTKSPVRLARVIGTATNGLYGWTSTIILVGATLVPDKTILTISGTFTYQLSLSTEGSNTANASDAGQATRTVYVQ
jgi:hypothetical protein